MGKLADSAFPGIVDVVEQEEERFLIMEWIEGETLAVQKMCIRDSLCSVRFIVFRESDAKITCYFCVNIKDVYKRQT